MTYYNNEPSMMPRRRGRPGKKCEGSSTKSETDLSFPKPQHASNNEKIDQIYFDYIASNKDIKIRNNILKKNQALVVHIVNKYYSAKEEHKRMRDDLVQEGTLGLISATEGYKPELGYQFSTFAFWWIRQAINNYILNLDPIIRIPGHIRTASNKVTKKLIEENITLQGFIDNYQKGMHLSDKMLYSIKCANKTKNMVYLDEPTKSYVQQSHSNNSTNAGGNSLGDILPIEASAGENGEISAEKKGALDELFDSKKMINIIREALDNLSDKERYILLLRFGVLKKLPANLDLKKKSIIEELQQESILIK